MFYSPSMNSFFEKDPGDGYEITAERHAEMLEGQGEGKTISAQKDGKPYLKSPAEATQEQKAAIVQSNRQRAYTLEADGLFMSWQYDKTAEAEAAWREKVTEIKKRFPYVSAD